MTLSPQIAHGTGNLLGQTFARLADLNLRSAFWRKEVIAIRRVHPISQPRLIADNPFLQVVDFDDNEGPVTYASFSVAPEDDSGW